MILNCDSSVVYKKTGENSKNQKWYLISILDGENDKHLNFFVKKEDYEQLKEDNIYRFYISLKYDLKSKTYIVKFLSYEVI